MVILKNYHQYNYKVSVDLTLSDKVIQGHNNQNINFKHKR